MKLHVFLALLLMLPTAWAENKCPGAITLALNKLTQVTYEAEPTFLYKNLLKKSPLFEGEVTADDLSADKLKSFMKHFGDTKIYSNASHQQRFDLIKDFPVGNIVAAPGHRQLRKIDQVMGLVEHIKSSGGGNFAHDKILINVLTDDDGKVISVDLWNAHHRLAAYVEAGTQTIGGMKSENMEILVNGVNVGGNKWGHWLPGGGVDWKNVHGFQVVNSGPNVEIGTISVDGARSNFGLGSRMSIAQLNYNTLKVPKRPKIAVYFGTFDPFHEGHMKTVENAIKNLDLDEVVIVPNINPHHKPGAISAQQRIEMIAARVKNTPKVNLYTGDSSVIIDKFGNSPLFDQMIQTYGTYDVHQIMGADAFSTILKTGEYAKNKNVNYIVLPRKGYDLPEMSQFKNAKALPIADDIELSSSKVREAIKERKDIPSNWLSPEIYQYIKDHGLYK